MSWYVNASAEIRAESGTISLQTLSDIATQVRLLHTLRLLLMSTVIGVAHEVYVLLMGAPKLPVMRISIVLDALNVPANSPLVDFLKPVTLPWLLLAFGSIRLKHFRDSTDLSTSTYRALQACLLFIVAMAGGLVVAPMSCGHFMLPLEIVGVFMEPLMFMFLLVSTNRLHLHHRYVQLATYGLAALLVLHVPITMTYLASAHPDGAVDAHAWAHLATSIRHALVCFILPMVLFVGDLGVNQLQSEVETQSMRNQLQLRFFRWLMHEQRSPLNDISISLSLAQDSVQEIRDLVPAAMWEGGGDKKQPPSPQGTKPTQGSTSRPLLRTNSAGSDGMLSPDDRVAPPADLARALTRAALSYVDESFDGVKRLQRVMHQVRDFGALVLSHTGFEGSALPFELHDMLTRTARRFQGLAARKKQVLHWRPLRLDANMASSEYSSIPTGEYASVDENGDPRPAVWVTADVVRLRSAIQNIVANAIKFTPKGKSIWVGSNVSLETAEGQRRRLQRGAEAVQDLTLRPLKQSCKLANTSCAKAQKVVGHCQVAEAVWGALSRDEAPVPLEGGSTTVEGGADGGRMFALWTTIVEDDGRGIPTEMQSDLWNPFSTLVPHENGQNQGGSGLSLIIARAVVEKHGGSLHVFSEGAGEGTRVVMQVSVPVHKGRPEELADLGAAYSIEPEIAQWASGSGSGGDGSSSDGGSGSNTPDIGRAWDAAAGVPPSGASQGGGSASGSNPGTGTGGSVTPSSQGSGRSLKHHGSGYGALHGTWGERGAAGTVQDVGDEELLTQLGLPADEPPSTCEEGGCSSADAASSGHGSDADEVQPVALDSSVQAADAAAVGSGDGGQERTAGAPGGENTPAQSSEPAGRTGPAEVAMPPDGLPIIPEGVAAEEAAAHMVPDRLPLRILCVDDAKTTRTLLRKLLKKRTQAEVVDVAENGQVAVDAVAARGVGYYSLILMDKEMPVMDGYQAARTIRSMGYRRTMLGVTGNALLADVAEFKRHGVCRVLTKPVDAAVLAKWAEFSTHYEHSGVHTAE